MSIIKLGFYCNANSTEGLGHFYRCLRLSLHINIKQFFNIVFLGDYNSIAKKELQSNNINFTNVSNFNELQYVPQYFDYLLIDTYLKSQSEINQASINYKCIFIDDFNLFDYSLAYGVINFTVEAAKLKYPQKIKLFLGPNFLPIKRKFIEIRKKRLSQKKIIKNKENINITFFFSGVDLNVELLKKVVLIFDVIFTNCKFIWILKNDIEDFETKNNSLEVISETLKIESIYEISDIIISGGGLVKYESSYCGIPNIAISTNEFQYLETIKFEECNLTNNFGLIQDFTLENAMNMINDFIGNYSCQEKFYENSNKYFNSEYEYIFNALKPILK